MEGTFIAAPLPHLQPSRCPLRKWTSLREQAAGLAPGSDGRHCLLPARTSRRQQRLFQLVCMSEAQRTAAFPAGKRQAKVQLPACFVSVEASEVERKTAVLSAMISAGATGILLTDTSDSGGAELYEAGVKLKEMIRGRAVLLVSERTDIAAAVEADGVALFGKGLPTLVARRMLKSNDSLVARIVDSPRDAATAAAEGANLIILQDKRGKITADEVKTAKTKQGSSGGIPVIAGIRSPAEVARLVTAAADGVSLLLGNVSEDAAAQQVKEILEGLQQQQQRQPPPERKNGSATARAPPAPKRQQEDRLKHFLNASHEDLLEAERTFLSASLKFIQEAAPELEELGLLKDALKQLDELFLVVVVGEFNSGKSSIINALLGSRYLAEGILPTTNEISVLKFSESGKTEALQDADGLYVRKLPAELLRDINIVDTPGTNVIVNRQQRLTEEYVPRADLVLFCMSADRPFTESETNFLRYIRQWGKKVVFVVNKVDILSNDREVNEVVQFVGNSATRLLGVDRSQVLPVSARAALNAKVEIGGGAMAGGILSSKDAAALKGNKQWESSRFGTLEDFVLNFLVGGSSAGESVRLKLQTPLFVAEALLEAVGKQLAEDLQAAEQDVEAVKAVQGQLESFERGMSRDSAAQRSECRKLVSGATKRAQNLVDSTLQLSNLDTLSGYIFGSRSDPGKLPVASAFKQEVVGPSAADLEELVQEHSNWLSLNCERQQSNYRNFAEGRAEQLGATLEDLKASGSGKSGSASSSANAAAEKRRKWRENREASQAEPESRAGAAETSLAVLKAFDPGAGALILEEEIRESVINTAGAALGAGFLGVIFTFVLPNTLEDLFALAIGGLVGYAALLNLPLRRADANAKLQRVANEFLEDLDGKMQAELQKAVEECITEINAYILPLQQRSEAVVTRIQSLQKRHEATVEELRGLKQRAANVE